MIFSVTGKKFLRYFIQHEWKIIIIVGIIYWLWIYFLNQYFLEGIPHVGDAVSYLIQAKYLALGKLFLQPKIFPEYYDFFKGWGPILYYNGKWFSPYPFCHPLLLSVGVILGNPSIIPPLIGTLSAIIIYTICRMLAGIKAALVAILLTITSPFFQMHSASFMSHNSSVFYLLLTIFFIIFKKKHYQNLFSFFSGISWGLLFNTRPLSAVSLSIIFLIILFLHKHRFLSFVFFGFGASLMIIIYAIVNIFTTGNPFRPAFDFIGPPLTIFPILANHVITVEVTNFKTAVSLFVQVAFGWPMVITIFFPIMAFFHKSLKSFVSIFWGAILIHAFFYFFYYTPGITYGPRMWFEILPFFIILTALGWQSLTDLFSYSPFLKYLPSIIVLLFVIRTLFGWITGSPHLYSYYFTPSSISELKTFNYTDARLIKEAQKKNIHSAVIFVKSNEQCAWQWWCYGSVMPQNNPTFDSDIIWATDLGERNQELQKLYPNRQFYLADYNQSTIQPLFLTTISEQKR